MIDYDLLTRVNAEVNEAITYRADRADERNDLQAMVDAYRAGAPIDGDCEEYARLKRAVLEWQGVDAEMWLVRGFTEGGDPHAWLEVWTPDHAYILDNLTSYVADRPYVQDRSAAECLALAKPWWEFANWPVHRWPNFKPWELACHDPKKRPNVGDGLLYVDAPSLDCLQRLRTALGRPLVVNSAYRSPAYNATLKGAAALSKHLLGKAFDIDMTGHDRALFEREAREAGFSGFGFYPDSNFIHIDTGPARQWGERW